MADTSQSANPLAGSELPRMFSTRSLPCFPEEPSSSDDDGEDQHPDEEAREELGLCGGETIGINGERMVNHRCIPAAAHTVDGLPSMSTPKSVPKPPSCPRSTNPRPLCTSTRTRSAPLQCDIGSGAVRSSEGSSESLAEKKSTSARRPPPNSVVLAAVEEVSVVAKASSWALMLCLHDTTGPEDVCTELCEGVEGAFVVTDPREPRLAALVVVTARKRGVVAPIVVLLLDVSSEGFSPSAFLKVQRKFLDVGADDVVFLESGGNVQITLGMSMQRAKSRTVDQSFVGGSVTRHSQEGETRRPTAQRCKSEAGGTGGTPSWAIRPSISAAEAFVADATLEADGLSFASQRKRRSDPAIQASSSARSSSRGAKDDGGASWKVWGGGRAMGNFMGVCEAAAVDATLEAEGLSLSSLRRPSNPLQAKSSVQSSSSRGASAKDDGGAGWKVWTAVRAKGNATGAASATCEVLSPVVVPPSTPKPDGEGRSGRGFRARVAAAATKREAISPRHGSASDQADQPLSMSMTESAPHSPSSVASASINSLEAITPRSKSPPEMLAANASYRRGSREVSWAMGSAVRWLTGKASTSEELPLMRARAAPSDFSAKPTKTSKDVHGSTND